MINFQPVRAWLDAPSVADDETLRQVSLINLLIKWGIIFLVATLLLWPVIANSRNAKQYLYISLALLIGLFAVKFVLNARRVLAAGYLLAAVFWLTFAIAALRSPDGLASTPFWALITITPVLAGFVNGTIASIGMTLLNWGLGGYMAWLDLQNPFQGMPYFEEPAYRFVALMIMASVFPLIVYVWHQNLQNALGHVRITEQAQAETAAYRLQNEALEEAVAIRTGALEESLTREQHMAEKLALALQAETQLSEMQSRIITVVSHEFRTPLSVINSSSELLQHYYERLPHERRAAAHLRIHESIFYLNDLLKDVTMVDKAQRARIRPSYHPYTFNSLCQQLIDQLRREVTDYKRIQFHFPPQVETLVQTDLTLLAQILTNLISNGLKYSEKEQLVHVSFWLDGLQLFIEVRDAGIGVPPHEQERIFDLFYRASNVDERRGLGLGLFIVQAVTNLMQGSVQLHSAGEGQGATFEVRLPLLNTLAESASSF
ncbi:MAG: HAMP domain-containing sensor histidine kinase [Chloroflexota bacterium]